MLAKNLDLTVQTFPNVAAQNINHTKHTKDINGDWKKFVSNQDNKPTKHVYKETTLQVKEYMTVRVDVFALKNYLIENGIVKP